ncbi:unnamed protein product [Nezara viridula]|uniref:Uncharacterized protein n=1 Tax=Nezara viridula TaxID=85310 RepID=A0A9P0EC38_NEZVI|nr:unnamed protein product [Nezara viridula]
MKSRFNVNQTITCRDKKVMGYIFIGKSLVTKYFSLIGILTFIHFSCPSDTFKDI